MKKSKISIIIIAVLVIAIGALAAVNIFGSKSAQDFYDAKEIQLLTANDEETIDFDDISEKSVTFEAVMKRKVGDPITNEYTGAPLAEILAAEGIEITESSKVTLTALDNYAIEITGAEVLDEGNAYLVFKQNGEDLDEKSGPYMLVLAHDELSTRWNKCLVSISVK